MKRVISGNPPDSGRRDGRPPFLERRVGAEETEGIDLDFDGAARAAGERCGQPSADGGAAMGPLAKFVNDQGILCKGRRGRGGIAPIERLGECRDEVGDRLFIGGQLWRPKESDPSAGFPGRSSPGKSRPIVRREQTNGSHSSHSS